MRSPLILATFFAGAKASEDGLQMNEKFFKQRRLDEVVSLSPIVAGQEPDSAISWENSEITAFRCDIVDLTGPVQVLHEEPVDQNNVQVAFYEFGAEIQGSYRLDDYDPTINEIIRDNGLVQPSRVNAAGMYVDEDKNGTNYPLAAFVFDEDDMVPPVSPAYLCRFDASRLECFTTPLFTRGERSHIPFVGVIVKNTYLYGNGLGIQDVDPMTSVAATRPLFLVRNINENEPAFESTEYYINRVDNSRMRCADLTSFDQDACFLDDGTQVDCVTTDDLGSESAVVPLATSFLTCIAQDAIGVILIALDSTQTPFAYNWVEGIDVVASDGEVYPPLAKTEDNAMAESQLIEDGQRLGNFGACYVVKEAFETATSRVMCSSNAGLGLFELVLPIEIGYCESSWTSVSAADDGTVNAESCKRFAPVCPECAGVGNKPLVGFIADSDTTNRNDGLNCNPTLLDVPEPPRTNQTAPPTPAPSPAPSPEPTKKQKCGLREKKDKKRYCWGHKGLFDRPYKSFGDGVLQIKMEGSRFKSTTSWHWWGVLEMPQSGKIKFKTTSGDSSQVWLFDEGEGLDGEQPDTSGATLIVDNTDYRRWGSTKSVESDWIQVEEGEKRVIHIFYGQKRRNTNMILRWKFQNSFYKSTLKPFFPCSDK